MAELTPFQTIGPFFEVAMEPPGVTRLGETIVGRRIVIEGTLWDGHGRPVPDGVIETWQADPRGALDQPGSNGFSGFGRLLTDANGSYRLETVYPGAIKDASGSQAPHVLVGVLARGILTRLITRIYFEDQSANAGDAVLAMVPSNRRSTLIAKATSPDHYRFDIRIQGPGETVFFDV